MQSFQNHFAFNLWFFGRHFVLFVSACIPSAWKSFLLSLIPCTGALVSAGTNWPGSTHRQVNLAEKTIKQVRTGYEREFRRCWGLGNRETSSHCLLTKSALISSTISMHTPKPWNSSPIHRFQDYRSNITLGQWSLNPLPLFKLLKGRNGSFT